ncbi:MAG: hypothetical protein SGJ04_02255 [Bacteroidota bacterium]|nr:hypothetical protein [Bacteroidota bacterium]
MGKKSVLQLSLGEEYAGLNENLKQAMAWHSQSQKKVLLKGKITEMKSGIAELTPWLLIPNLDSARKQRELTQAYFNILLSFTENELEHQVMNFNSFVQFGEIEIGNNIFQYYSPAQQKMAQLHKDLEENQISIQLTSTGGLLTTAVYNPPRSSVPAKHLILIHEAKTEQSIEWNEVEQAIKFFTRNFHPKQGEIYSVAGYMEYAVLDSAIKIDMNTQSYLAE